MDERQELNAGRASMIVLGVIALIALGVLAWEYITTKDVTNGWAIATLLGSGALLALLTRTMGGPEIPPHAAGHRTAHRLLRRREGRAPEVVPHRLGGVLRALSPRRGKGALVVSDTRS